MNAVQVPLRGTIGDIAAALGVEAGEPADLYAEHAEFGADEELAVDPVAAELLLDWFARGDRALRRFAPSEEPILWPEHFDLGIAPGEVNYGVSPGDGAHPLPYAYVGPWTPRHGASGTPLRRRPDGGATARRRRRRRVLRRGQGRRRRWRRARLSSGWPERQAVGSNSAAANETWNRAHQMLTLDQAGDLGPLLACGDRSRSSARFSRGAGRLLEVEIPRDGFGEAIEVGQPCPEQFVHECRVDVLVVVDEAVAHPCRRLGEAAKSAEERVPYRAPGKLLHTCRVVRTPTPRSRGVRSTGRSR